MRIGVIILLLLATGCGVSFQEETGATPAPAIPPTVTATVAAVATAILTATQAPTATATRMPTLTVAATPTATATVTPTVTATPTPTATATHVPTATPKPVAQAAPAPQAAPAGPEVEPPPPSTPPSLPPTKPPYWETGVGLTAAWTIQVPTGSVLIVGGYRVGNQSNGVYRAYTGGQTITLTVTDGFATMVSAEAAPAEFCARVGQARQYGWAHSIVEPLPGWPAC